MGLFAGVIVVLVLLLLAARYMSRRRELSGDPVVIEMSRLHDDQFHDGSLPLHHARPHGPEPATALDEDIMAQLSAGTLPPPCHRPRRAGRIPAPDPPRPVGQLLNENTGPPSYGPVGADAYCPV